MKIGMIGAGKLGLPVALAINDAGHDVIVTDIDLRVQTYLRERKIPYREEGAEDFLSNHTVQWAHNIYDVVKASEIIFVAVQTPHEPQYEGITPIPDTRADFDYTYLKEAVNIASDAADIYKERKTLVIISTVLPGTIEREIYPILSKKLHLIYNPFFIAMGTTIRDFTNPEFVLIGIGDQNDQMVQSEVQDSLDKILDLYATIHLRPNYKTSIKNAEMIKVAYNTYISMKIAYANTMMEMCHMTGADVDAVMGAITKADERLMSGKYLQGGMGDGGGCHPRDNIAMSWLARELGIKHDFFYDIMKAREDQSSFLAELAYHEHKESGLPIVLLGISFKEQTNIVTGSPALLLAYQLNKMGMAVMLHDPHVESYARPVPDFAAVYVISTRHKEFQNFMFPDGSVIIDPWGHKVLTANADKIKHIPIGRRTDKKSWPTSYDSNKQ